MSSRPAVACHVGRPCRLSVVQGLWSLASKDYALPTLPIRYQVLLYTWEMDYLSHVEF